MTTKRKSNQYVIWIIFRVPGKKALLKGGLLKGGFILRGGGDGGGEGCNYNINLLKMLATGQKISK